MNGTLKVVCILATIGVVTSLALPIVSGPAAKSESRNAVKTAKGDSKTATPTAASKLVRRYEYRSVHRIDPVSEETGAVGPSKEALSGDSKVIKLDLRGTVTIVCDGVSLYLQDEVTSATGWDATGRQKDFSHRITPTRKSWLMASGEVYRQELGPYAGQENGRLIATDAESISRDWLFGAVLPDELASGFGIQSKFADAENSRKRGRTVSPCPGGRVRERPELAGEGISAMEYTRSLMDVLGAVTEDFDTELTIVLAEEESGLPIEIDTQFVLGSPERSANGVPVAYDRYRWTGSAAAPVVAEAVLAMGAEACTAIRGSIDPFSMPELPAGTTLLRIANPESAGERSSTEPVVPPLPSTRFLDVRSGGVSEVIEVQPE